MKYRIELHSKRGYHMGTIHGNNKKKLIEEAQEQMPRLKKSVIEKYYLLTN